MSTDNFLAWLPGMLQAGDALFPTGSYAHSFGLEGCVQLGLVGNAQELERHLHERTIPALREFELPYVRFSFDAAGEPARLAEIDDEIRAAKLARATRDASARVGRRRLEALRLLVPAHPLLANPPPGRHQIVAFAVQGAVLEAPLQAILLAYFYQAIAAVGAAALKLIRIGQEGVQRALAGANRLAAATVAASLDVRREDAGWFDPLLEIASMRHERAGERLFIS